MEDSMNEVRKVAAERLAKLLIEAIDAGSYSPAQSVTDDAFSDAGPESLNEEAQAAVGDGISDVRQALEAFLARPAPAASGYLASEPNPVSPNRAYELLANATQTWLYENQDALPRQVVETLMSEGASEDDAESQTQSALDELCAKL